MATEHDGTAKVAEMGQVACGGLSLQPVRLPIAIPNFTLHNRIAMTAVELRAEIIRMIENEGDTSVLEAIRTLLFRLYLHGEDDLTDDEVAELEGRYQGMVSGKTKAHTREESMAKVRRLIA